ncbi:MAG: ABC transporter ATP-binding protein [Bacteroidota bacterium]
MNILKKNIETEMQNGNYHVALKRCIDFALNMPFTIEIKDVVLAMADSLNAEINNETINNQITLFFDIYERLNIQTNAEDSIVVDVQEISKRYNVGAFQFKPVSFQLKTGELTGIVGQNGNGKTTLLRMLCGDLMPWGGDIIYPELSLKNDPYAIKQYVGFIPQRIPKWYGKLEENLIFTLSGKGIPKDEILFRVEVMLKRLGLYQYRQHLWSEISSGYRTRFELARILLVKPKVLILDEPLANLDIMAQQTFLQDLKFMVKSEIYPMSIILSSQLLHEVEQVSDNVIFIKDGTCIFQNGKENNSETGVVEFITDNSFQQVSSIAMALGAEIKSESNFYTLSVPKSITSKQVLQSLIESDIDIQYFRNITNSTKRLF